MNQNLRDAFGVCLSFSAIVRQFFVADNINIINGLWHFCSSFVHVLVDEGDILKISCLTIDQLLPHSCRAFVCFKFNLIL